MNTRTDTSIHEPISSARHIRKRPEEIDQSSDVFHIDDDQNTAIDKNAPVFSTVKKDLSEQTSEKSQTRMISANMQRKRWLNCLYLRAGVIVLQEVQNLSWSRLSKDFLSKSLGRKMISWTSKRHTVLINQDHYQLIQIEREDDTTMVANIHLLTNPKQRSAQLEEIQKDIAHIQQVTKSLNLVMMGDFNCMKQEIKLELKRRGPICATWRKNVRMEYKRQIDHVYTSKPCSVSVKAIETESDHMALIIEMLYTGTMKSLCFPVTLSRLSKAKTSKSDLENWTSYPKINILGHQSGDRLDITLRTEKSFRC